MPRTRESLHMLGEHVLAAARYRADGRIGLSVVAGGIATPSYGPEGTVAGVIGGELVVRSGGTVRRQPVTTLRAAGEFVGVTPGAPAQVYAPATACDLDAPLELDADELARLTAWYELVDAALRQFRSQIADDGPSEVTVWPEHFDAAIRAADVNFGGLAGDGAVALPYVYVGPDPAVLAQRPATVWNQPFGASATWDEISQVEDAVSFFARGRDAVRDAGHDTGS